MSIQMHPSAYVQREPTHAEILADSFSKAFVPSFTGTLQQRLEEHHDQQRARKTFDDMGSLLSQAPKDADPQQIINLGRRLGSSPDAIEGAIKLHQQTQQNKLAQQKASMAPAANRNIINAQDSSLISQVLESKPNAKPKDFLDAGVTLSGLNSWRAANKTSVEDSEERRVRKDINKEIKDMNLDDEDSEYVKLKVDEYSESGMKPFKALDKARKDIETKNKNIQSIRSISEDADVPGFFGGSKESKIKALQPKYKNLSESQKELALDILTKEKGWTREEAIKILSPEKAAQAQSIMQQLLEEAGGDVNKARDLARQRGYKITG